MLRTQSDILSKSESLDAELKGMVSLGILFEDVTYYTSEA